MDVHFDPRPPLPPASSQAGAAPRPAPLPQPRLLRPIAISTSAAVASLQLVRSVAAGTADAAQPTQRQALVALQAVAPLAATPGPTFVGAAEQAAQSRLWRTAISGTLLEAGVYAAILVGLSLRAPWVRPMRSAAVVIVGLCALRATAISFGRVRADGELNVTCELGLIALSVRNQVNFLLKACSFYAPLIGCIGLVIGYGSQALAREISQPAHTQPVARAATAHAGIDVHPLLPAFGDESSPEDIARVRKLAEAWPA